MATAASRKMAARMLRDMRLQHLEDRNLLPGADGGGGDDSSDVFSFKPSPAMSPVDLKSSGEEVVVAPAAALVKRLCLEPDMYACDEDLDDDEFACDPALMKHMRRADKAAANSWDDDDHGSAEFLDRVRLADLAVGDGAPRKPPPLCTRDILAKHQALTLHARYVRKWLADPAEPSDAVAFCELVSELDERDSLHRLIWQLAAPSVERQLAQEAAAEPLVVLTRVTAAPLMHALARSDGAGMRCLLAAVPGDGDGGTTASSGGGLLLRLALACALGAGLHTQLEEAVRARPDTYAAAVWALLADLLCVVTHCPGPRSMLERAYGESVRAAPAPHLALAARLRPLVDADAHAEARRAYEETRARVRAFVEEARRAADASFL